MAENRRTVVVPDETWSAWKRMALDAGQREGSAVSVSELIRRAVERYDEQEARTHAAARRSFDGGTSRGGHRSVDAVDGLSRPLSPSSSEVVGGPKSDLAPMAKTSPEVVSDPPPADTEAYDEQGTREEASAAATDGQHRVLGLHDGGPTSGEGETILAVPQLHPTTAQEVVQPQARSIRLPVTPPTWDGVLANSRQPFPKERQTKRGKR